jgi:hypothetical protein
MITESIGILLAISPSDDEKLNTPLDPPICFNLVNKSLSFGASIFSRMSSGDDRGDWQADMGSDGVTI